MFDLIDCLTSTTLAVPYSVFSFFLLSKFKARAISRDMSIQEVKAVGKREMLGCIAW